MKSKLLKLLSLAIIGVASLNAVLALPTYADDVCSSNAPASVKEAAGCSGNKNALPGIILNIVRAVIIVSGIVAVIWIIIGGVNYITSSGDPTKIKKARETILYAVIGLIICVLAFAIVNFVIGTLDKV